MNMLVCILTFSFLLMTEGDNITISADKTLPRDGETVNLICIIPSFKVPATWSVSNTSVSLTNCLQSGSCQPPNDAARYSYTATASSISVTITSFRSTNDTFGWKCQLGTNYAVYVIKPVVPVTTVQLTQTSGETFTSTINVVRERITYIRCSTAPNGSRPRAVFRWYKRSVNQSAVLIENHYISSTLDAEPGQRESNILISYSTLTLTGNASYHNMYILCEARDENSTGDFIQSAEAQLNIMYLPVVHLSPNDSMYNVTEGTLNYVFTCNIIEANPLPQPNGYSWLHKSVVIQGQTSSSYIIPSVQKSDDGEYICTARNDYGNGTSNALTLNVQYPAKITAFFAKDNISEIMENSTLELYCHVDSNPYSDISLTFGDVLTSTTQDSNELIHNATAGCLHAGKYICSATNTIMNGSNVSADINLKVNCHPRFDFRRNISDVYYRALKDNVTLEVSVIAYPEPTNIMWYHRVLETDIWQPFLTQSFSSDGLDSHISVHLGSHRDFGDYLVNMSNSFGIYEHVYRVISNSAPGVPTDIFIISRSYDSITLEWTPGFWGGNTQNFTIEYRMYPHETWMDAGSILEDTNVKKQFFTVNGLQQKTTYEFRLYARNNIGKSNTTQIIKTTTSEVKLGQDELQIGPIAGGVVSVAIVAVFCIILIFIRRRNLKNKEEAGLVDNPVYDTSDPRYGPSTSEGTSDAADAAVVKPKRKATMTEAAMTEDPSELYTQVDKANTKVNTRHVYQNIELGEKSTNAELKNENSKAETCVDSVYENPGNVAPDNHLVNKDGLLYADLMMDSPTNININEIRGIDNRSEYADIAYGKRGEPLGNTE